jgi:hypothetical protein
MKMIALTLEGIGIIVSGLSLGYLVTGFNGVFGGASPFTSFLNTLEAGLIIAGIGAIVLGIALFVESLS